MEKIATPVNKKVSPVGADQIHFHLSEPLGGFTDVVVSAVTVVYTGPETYIFGADESGKIVEWTELDGSYRGGLDHNKALANAGYLVEAEPD